MSSVLLNPVISEKALGLAETERTYIFMVPKELNKIEVGQAVAKRFKVKVNEVNTVIVKGKVKKTVVQRGRRSLKGQRSDFKKAYVTLAEGQSIPLFEGAK